MTIPINISHLGVKLEKMVHYLHCLHRNAFFQKVNAFLKKVVHFFRWGATLPKTHIFISAFSAPFFFETLSRPWQVQVVQAVQVVQVVQHILVFQFHCKKILPSIADGSILFSLWMK